MLSVFAFITPRKNSNHETSKRAARWSCVRFFDRREKNQPLRPKAARVNKSSCSFRSPCVVAEGPQGPESDDTRGTVPGSGRGSRMGPQPHSVTASPDPHRPPGPTRQARLGRHSQTPVCGWWTKGGLGKRPAALRGEGRLPVPASVQDGPDSDRLRGLVETPLWRSVSGERLRASGCREPHPPPGGGHRTHPGRQGRPMGGEGVACPRASRAKASPGAGTGGGKGGLIGHRG